MEKVSTIEEIHQSLVAFDELKTRSLEERKGHARAIKNGKYFVVFENEERRIFAPGNVCIYKAEDSGQTRIKTAASLGIIDTIIGQRIRRGDIGYDQIDVAYMETCKELGVVPSKHRTLRAYWIYEKKLDPHEQISADIEEIENNKHLSETEKDALIKARRGQGKFRLDLKKRWGSACAVTGYRQDEVLRASHIKDWKSSGHMERLNYKNGLLLCANLDALFDRKLISFEDDGTMIVSSRIGIKERRQLGIPQGLRLPLTEEEKEFLRWHRKIARRLGNVVCFPLGMSCCFSSSVRLNFCASVSTTSPIRWELPG